MQVILSAVLLVTSVAMSCLAVEVGYRGYQYLTLPGRLAALVAQQNPGGYDPRYRPDSKADTLCGELRRGARASLERPLPHQ